MNHSGLPSPPPDPENEVAGLKARLAEAEDALRAIRMGEVDALVGDVAGNSQLFVLQSSDVESNRFHGEILSKVNDAVIAFDMEGHITYLNLAAESQYGVTASKVLGCHLNSVCEIRWETPESEIEANRAMEQDGWWQGENVHVRKDGTVLHVESSATRFSDPDGTPAGYLHVVRDISQRRESETALRESEARYRALFNSIDEGFCIIRVIFDQGGNPVDYLFLHISPSFEAQTGLKDALGRTAKEMLPAHEDYWFQIYGKVARGGPPVRFQHEASQLGRWFDVYASSFGDPADHEVAIIFNDITFRMQAEEKMRADAETLAAADRRKDEFLAMLAHELRNPLAPMLPGVEVLMMRPEDPSVVKRIGGMLRRQVDQMAHLIDDLLDMSRITTGKISLKLETIPLAPVIGQAVESVQPLVDASRHELVVDEVNPGVLVKADSHRLTQIISNLLSNAAKYTPSGGRISLSVTHPTDGGLRISVKDNGKGISPEHQRTIFDLFDQGGNGAADGLGIGLTLVRSLVDMHGGTISVASGGEGEGSEFTLALPVAVVEVTGSAAGKPAEEPQADATPRKLRVLVADDGKPTADILAMFFKMEGMDAVVAYDGQQAVELAERFLPDLVCLDLGMPVVDGYEAARSIRGLRPEACIVALTGWGSEEDRRKTAEAGFDEHLTKPVNPDDLRKLVKRRFS